MRHFIGVLDEDEDVLLNVNIIDDEKAAKNVELRKGKPGYNPYEEEEVDEYGNVSLYFVPHVKCATMEPSVSGQL